MNNIEFAKVLLCEASELLNESAGANNLYNRLNISDAETRSKNIDNMVSELNNSKNKIRSKHKIKDIDAKIDALNAHKSNQEKTIKDNKDQLKNKGSEMQRYTKVFGERNGMARAKSDNESRKKMAESHINMIKHSRNGVTNKELSEKQALLHNKINARAAKKAQNECANIATLLTEAALLLNN